MARLYDLGGATIWAPAILHFVSQGAVKLVVVPDRQMMLGMGWMAVYAVVPWAASRSGDALPQRARQRPRLDVSSRQTNGVPVVSASTRLRR